MAKKTQTSIRIHNRMDNPVDNIVDLGLVNYVKHPSNSDYIVFRFADQGRALSFENALIEEKIEFEKAEEPKRTRIMYLFGIHKRDFTKAQKINFLVEAEHKKPFIPFRIFRWFIILFSITALTLAILGYCEQQDTLTRIKEDPTSVNSTQ